MEESLEICGNVSFFTVLFRWLSLCWADPTDGESDWDWRVSSVLSECITRNDCKRIRASSENLSFFQFLELGPRYGRRWLVYCLSVSSAFSLDLHLDLVKLSGTIETYLGNADSFSALQDTQSLVIFWHHYYLNSDLRLLWSFFYQIASNFSF